MNSKLYEGLTRQYSLSKTLRFELIPIAETKDNIIKNQILQNDEKRSIQYKRLKKQIDEYHKFFIDNSLEELELSDLNEYYTVYKELKTSKDLSLKKDMENIKKKIRKQIAERFMSQKEFKGIFGAQIIKEYLLDFVKSSENKDSQIIEDIKDFSSFTTYFKGFHDNRKNIYTYEDKATSICHRIVDENLPVFMNNINIYKKIKETISENDLMKLREELEKFLMVDDIDDMFTIEYFNNVLSQKGIEIYNVLISGYSDSDGKKIKGLNELINLHNQKAPKENRVPKIRQLYKQILSDRLGASFVIDEIDSDGEVVELLRKFNQNYIEKVINSNEKEEMNIRILLNNINRFDLNKIYLGNLNGISVQVYGDWSIIINAVSNDYDASYMGKRKPGDEKYIKEKESYIKNNIFSLGDVLRCLKDNGLDEYRLLEYFLSYGNNNLIFKKIADSFNDLSSIFESYDNKSKELIKDEEKIVKIKAYLDNVMTLLEDISVLSFKDDTLSKDDFFYNSFYEIYSNLKLVIGLYNKVRNYLTQKPYSDEKIKINFENSTLLDGWDLNKESANLSIMLKKDGLFYLGVINKDLKDKHLFAPKKYSSWSDMDDFYEKMEYKLLPGPNKMLPKVFFSKSRIDEFNPSAELLEKYERGCHKKGDNFDLKFCHELIDFFKDSINKHEWKEFGFNFSTTSTYKDISGFYREVESQGYKISFKNIPSGYIKELIKENKLYLFKIYNKDFSPYSKGKPNLHTLYFKSLFERNKSGNVNYKLNGQAEVFYRKASLKLDETVIHKKNEEILNKNSLNQKKTSKFNYDLIKDKRFTEDKFFFHLPITLNYSNEGNENLNYLVNRNIKENDDLYIIGIDRGERHLIYLSLIKSDGQIVKQFSLNEIINEFNNQSYAVDYKDLLEEKAKNRDEARKNWKEIKNIKELKEGYLSQVINKVVELMDEYKAIIVMEDLNYGFKNSRVKFEKQVYQKFEKMLIDKLNYLVIKKKDVDEPGGLQNAYQLTNKVLSLKNMPKQSGVLFYIPAWNTSKIDPTTGFVNLFNTRYENIDKTKEFIGKFKDIRFNESEKYFEFDFDYNDFTNRSYGMKNEWCLCTYSTRVETFRDKEANNNWNSREIVLTDAFIELFEEFGVDINSIKDSLMSQTSKDVFERFMYLMKLTLQIRNSVVNSSIDYMVSPVKNSNGVFYDTRLGNHDLPLDADANGAYNIARKGAMLIDQIKGSSDDELKKIKFSISNDEWLTYVQSKSI